LYGPPGFAYVYFTYGMHHLVNAVTEDEGRPAAVLIRALEPRDGVPAMRQRRSWSPDRDPQGLCRGPGNLTQALGIDLTQNRLDLTSSSLAIEDRGVVPGPLAWSPRIGIRVGRERPWRVFVVGHPAVSGRRVPAAGRGQPSGVA
jgi:DNA-3-methyladenine glycosylase